VTEATTIGAGVPLQILGGLALVALGAAPALGRIG